VCHLAIQNSVMSSFSAEYPSKTQLLVLQCVLRSSVLRQVVLVLYTGTTYVCTLCRFSERERERVPFISTVLRSSSTTYRRK